jgi:hypothetical protein
MTLAQFIGCGLALYAAAGLCTAIAFVTIGLERAMPQPASFTLGARIWLLPGAFALWPYIVVRLLKGTKQ